MELLLLSYVVIIPISLKVANHKYSVGYIVSYMNKFLEEHNEENSFKWEKFYMKYYEINQRTFREKLIYYGLSAEYALMTILTTAIFGIKYLYQSKIKFSAFQMHGYIFLQIIIIIFVIYVTISYMSFQKNKTYVYFKLEQGKKDINKNTDEF